MDGDMAGRDSAVRQVEDALARLDVPAGKTPVRQLPGEATETGTPPGSWRGFAPDGRIFAARDRAGKASVIIAAPWFGERAQMFPVLGGARKPGRIDELPILQSGKA